MHILGLVFFTCAFLAALSIIWSMIGGNFRKVATALAGVHGRDHSVNLAGDPAVDRRRVRSLTPRQAHDRRASPPLPLAA